MKHGRPSAVARYERRPLWWFAAAAALFAWTLVDAVSSSNPREPAEDDLVVTGVVTDDDANLRLPVKYTHPITEQEIELDAIVHRASLRTPAGSTVELIVSPGDPGDVEVVGDRKPPSDVAWEATPFVAFPLAVYLRRRWHRRRVEQLIASDAPSFAMLGALGPPRKGGTRPLLSLYALDAPVGAEPVCSVPVLATNGTPFGSLLPIEVKGSPRTHGRVVARHLDVFWPTGRATGRGGVARPARQLEPNDEPPADERSIDAPRWSGWAKVWLIEWIVIAACLALIAVVSLITVINARQARDLERNGTPIVVTVKKRGTTVLDVTYTSTTDGSEIAATTPVDYPEDYTVDRRYPARVDPENPQRLRLVAEPYDAVEPIGWAVTPLVIVVAWLISRAVRFGRGRRAARHEPTRPFGGRVVRIGNRVVDLEIGRFDEPGPRCMVRVARSELSGRFHGPLLVRGVPEPGRPVAVRYEDRTLTVLGPARCPTVT